jgi:enoyl-CoA hydratase
MEFVEFEVVDGAARITLNRPQAINALSLDMLHAIEDQLIDWFGGGQIASVEISGNGPRGYCSGADVREIVALCQKEANAGLRYLRDEYRLDAMIVNSPVPVSCDMRGISMGGGLGLGEHTESRVGHRDTLWAMPEVGIGLWPDVGVCFELSHTPGELGTFVALTGQTIDAASAVYAGLIDEAEGVDAHHSALAQNEVWINSCFVGDDVPEILERLDRHPAEAAQETAQLIRGRAPLSVCVTLEALRRAADMASVIDVLDQDLVLASNFVRNPDFIEGVRAQLIDKDRTPHWQHARIEDVTRAEVEAMFS